MGRGDSETSITGERLAGILILSGVAIFTVFDLIEDSRNGSSLGHCLAECGVVLLSLCGAGYLWRRVVGTLVKGNDVLKRRLVEARDDVQRWRTQTESLAQGISAAIEQQLQQWGLSPAERDVAFLLLKGLSFKELASIRATSERTVRQQAAAIYSKAGLEGRAQLSAFFLEDLLVSRQNDRPEASTSCHK